MKFLFTLILGLISISAFSADNILVLRLANSSAQMYNIHEPITIKTSEDSVFINSEHITASYSRSNLKGYHFTTDGSIIDAIDSPTLSSQSNVTVSRSGDIITISGVCEDSKARIFSTNGIEFTPSINYSEGTITVDFSSLTPSVYLIHISGCPGAPSLKFTKY